MVPCDALTRGRGAAGEAVVACRAIPAGTPVLRVEGPVCRRATQHSVQLAADVQLLPEGRLWGCLNHACEPSCRFEFETWSVVTVRDVAPGEELTVDYLTTEWDLLAPFACACGAPGCYRRVAGLRHAPDAVVERLRPYLSPFLAAQVAVRR